ncbi:MAG: SH3 domain-containing protein [Thermomicrobiales bacterium]|nr:SH3 domain-containing protein [Thermomicrobiales bacterium]
MRRNTPLLLIAATSLLVLSPAAAQEGAFPASAVIRGENIRLWADPSFEAEELEILQRGDAVTVTGEAVAAEGDEFYPVESAEGGQAGWVRTVFINPASIVPIQVLEPADEPRQNRRNRDQAADTAGGEQGGASADAEARQERRARRQAEQDAAAQADAGQSANPVPVEQTPAEDSPAALPPVDAVDDAPLDDVPPGDASGLVSLAGEGTGTSDPVALEAGDYRVVMTSEVSAPSDVVVRLLDADGQAQRLFRESVGAQSWTGESDVTVEAAGDYTVRVSGLDDAWTLMFEPLPAGAGE